MENFVLNKNGQIDINRKGMENVCGFRLQEINHNTEVCSSRDLCDDATTSVSSYSNTFKQRIDAMFDDSRSLLSEMSRSERKVTSFSRQGNSYKERAITNNIQEKIEKMFEEISLNGIQRTGTREERRTLAPPAASAANCDFTVTYLGSKPLRDKNVSLTSLQDPLKELYFEREETATEDKINVLKISKQGLSIRAAGNEELHPFPTIAVWAAVKLTFRVKPDAMEYAFLPLIKDPDGIDKNSLFRELKDERGRVLPKNLESHSPIFAVVMKNINANKRLECHGFICKSSEEAIVIAANLYQALMKKLKRRREHKDMESKESEGSSEVEKLKPKVKIKKPAPPAPARPPRKPKLEKKEGGRASNEVRKEVGETALRRRGSVPENVLDVGTERARTLRRTVSDRGTNGITVKDKCEAGDILTKVAIPRSQSFLNANGPLTRFSRIGKRSPHNEILSPLGFKELFHEFKLQEGLENMDDILGAIIDAEGMSFNDLKPIYKEFLLKLAMTLTKDELYQRSKVIMRRQRKRSRNCNFRKRPFVTTIGLHKVFKKTACKLGRNKNSRPTNLEFTSVVFQPTIKQFESKIPTVGKSSKGKPFGNKKRQNSRRRLTKRLGKFKNKNLSTTSEESLFFQKKNEAGPNRSSSGYFSFSECSYDSENCTCTSVDKCYCSLGHKKKYETASSDESGSATKSQLDACTVAKTNEEPEQEDSLKSCSCDTESCANSGKCYCGYSENAKNKVCHLDAIKGICQTPHLHKKERWSNGGMECPVHRGIERLRAEDRLKERGFVGSESTSTRAPSPANIWQGNEKRGKRGGCTKTTASLECLRIQRVEHECAHLQYAPHGHEDERGFANAFEGPSSFEAGERKNESAGMRRYGSMRCRDEFLRDLTNSDLFHRSISCGTQNIFNSVRSKYGCNVFANHIKFPNVCSNNSSLRFTRRMDVYNSFSEWSFDRGDFAQPSRHKENWKKVGPMETEIFHSNSEFVRLNRERHPSPKTETWNRCESKKKILVVSARDPRGKVVYMGASSRGEGAATVPAGMEGSCANASEALAVKKSAEIAALFSDVTAKQKTIRSDHCSVINTHARAKSYRSANLENGLGYLP